MARSAALRRYLDATEAYHQLLDDTPESAAVTEAFAALPLPVRIRTILTVPWRDALDEILTYCRERSRR